MLGIMLLVRVVRDRVVVGREMMRMHRRGVLVCSVRMMGRVMLLW